MTRVLRYREKTGEFDGHHYSWYIYSDQEIEFFKKRYSEGVELTLLAKEMGRTPKQMRYLRLRLGLKLRRKTPEPVEWTKQDDNDFVTLYKQGLQLKVITRTLKKPYGSVQRAIKRNNLTSRLGKSKDRVNLSLYLSKTQYESVQFVANTHKQTVSAYCRKMVLDSLPQNSEK